MTEIKIRLLIRLGGNRTLGDSDKSADWLLASYATKGGGKECRQGYAVPSKAGMLT